ncbi:MAG TPA: N-6 DNA methylase [Gemmatimonadaceae bacterium]|nr:N-6 DNA methylase [Gemmatimonadaceae bacterium]
MLTLRAAAALLAAAPGIDALRDIARIAGCDGDPAPLAPDARDALGLPESLLDARVCGGPGALRALLLRCPRDASPRAVVAQTATRLAARTPQLLWLVAAEDDPAAERVIATWSVHRTPPRVAALSVTRDRLVDSDAEALCAIAAAAGPDDLLTHARWLEVLGRDALGRRFYRELEGSIGALAASLPSAVPEAEGRTLALCAASRLLFLAFLEAKGWLDGDRAFLARVHGEALDRGGAVHRRLLDPLFFGTLNTRIAERAPAARQFGRIPYLNGGLFTRTPLERRWRYARFTDDALAALFDGVLARYRLTAREDRATWSDAAVDPEMLGRAFESLMASPERRSSGAFYTPQPLVADLMTEALAAALERGGVARDDALRALAAEPLGADARERVARRLASLRLLDPACGSGAFLVHALERIADIARSVGDERDVGAIRRDMLARSIFGVDVNPMAVWLCELRLWLSTIIETEVADHERVPSLPNLDHNIRVGDSLSGAGFGASPRDVVIATRPITVLRGRYARSTGARKRSLARLLDRAERQAAIASLEREVAALVHRRRETLLARRQRDLFGQRRREAGPDPELARLRERLRAARAELRALGSGAALPFSYPACFPDVAPAGFDLVVGNPPWVRLHNIDGRSRQRLRERFVVFRLAAWESGAAGAGAGHGFAAQVDLAALFVERAVDLLAADGALALLLPAKLWRSLAGGGLRRLLGERCAVTLIEDLTEAAPSFDAAVYPSLLVALRGPAGDPVRCALRRRDRSLAWTTPRDGLALDATPGSPWLLAPPEVRAAFDRLRRGADTLATSVAGRPLLGVKTGCNEAFVLSTADAGALTIARPLVRGETLTPWVVRPAERILWTHDSTGAALAELPAAAMRRLAAHRRTLERRSDLRGAARWWSLFRIESARCDRARVVWADVGRSVRAACLPPGDQTVALNSCYVARLPTLEDALALTALLNSSLLSAWLGLVAEPARGGYNRYLGWTLALAPIPRDWARARDILAPLGRRGLDGSPPSGNELLESVVAAFRMRRSDLAPLVAWEYR